MEKEKTVKAEPEEKRSIVTSIIVGAVGAFCAAYILNPTAGLLEFIPDNIPGIGNLDEAAAAALLVSCLAYFGLDITKLFGKKSVGEDKSDVIDIDVEDR